MGVPIDTVQSVVLLPAAAANIFAKASVWNFAPRVDVEMICAFRSGKVSPAVGEKYAQIRRSLACTRWALAAVVVKAAAAAGSPGCVSRSSFMPKTEEGGYCPEGESTVAGEFRALHALSKFCSSPIAWATSLSSSSSTGGLCKVAVVEVKLKLVGSTPGGKSVSNAT